MDNTKLLTVSIAAYNVEPFIRQCIESCLVPEIMDRLEVLVIDDGATDNSGRIANEYAARYPSVVRVIHKENGGYGTTLNVSMKEATGRYFKVLDGDDWFERDGLIELVHTLEEADADVIVTAMRTIYCDKEGAPKPENEQSPLKQPLWAAACGATHRLSEIEQECRYLANMHTLTFRTELMREHPFTLPGRVFYMDTYYALYPFCFADTVRFMTEVVYNYRFGRDEQTASRSARMNHLEDMKVLRKLLGQMYDDRVREGRRIPLYVRQRIADAHANDVYKIYTLFPASVKWLRQIASDDRELKQRTPELYKLAGRRQFTRLLRRTGYLFYWPCVLLKLVK